MAVRRLCPLSSPFKSQGGRLQSYMVPEDEHRIPPNEMGLYKLVSADCTESLWCVTLIWKLHFFQYYYLSATQPLVFTQQD